MLLHALLTVAMAASPGDEFQVDFVGGRLRIEGYQSPAWEAVEPAEERICVVVVGTSPSGPTLRTDDCQGPAAELARSLIASWSLDLTGSWPVEQELVRIGLVIPGPQDARRGLLASITGPDDLGATLPSDIEMVPAEGDCPGGWGGRWSVVGTVIGATQPSYVEPEPVVTCTVSMEIDRFGDTAVSDIQGCPESAWREAGQRALSWSEPACPIFSDGRPATIQKEHRIHVVSKETVSTSDAHEAVDYPQIRVRTDFDDEHTQP